MITAIDSNAKVRWSELLDHEYDPGGIICLNKYVLYGDGPMSVGAVNTYGSLKGWLEQVRESIRIKCANPADGSLRWNKPWLQIGTPLCSLPDDVFLTLRPDLPVVGEHGVWYRKWRLETRRASTGARLQAWTMPLVKTGNRDSDYETLSDLLRLSRLRWGLVNKNDSFVFHADEVKDFDHMDYSIRKTGWYCVIRIRDGKAKVSISGPKRITLNLKPYTAGG